jgi:hypothetical protein
MLRRTVVGGFDGDYRPMIEEAMFVYHPSSWEA